MRLKVTHYDNTRSTVFSLAVWNTELDKLPTAERYIEVIVKEQLSVVDRLHALLLLANEVERYHAATRNGKTEVPGAVVPKDAPARTKEPVSL